MDSASQFPPKQPHRWPWQRDFAWPSFLLVVVIILALGGAAYGSIWWWGNRSSLPTQTFTPRPSVSASPTTTGQFCGGIAPGAFPCPAGYSCKLDGDYPDAGGRCVPN